MIKIMKREKRTRNPSQQNYPQFCFRIPDNRAKQFERVKKTIEQLYERYKKMQAEDEKTIKRNDIIIEALEIGCKALKEDLEDVRVKEI